MTADARHKGGAPVSTFVLIPGGGGDTWCWHRLEPELRRRGHEAVSVDLPNEESVTLSDHIELGVAAASGHPDVVVVGHSMGAFSAPVVAEQVGARLLVLLNAMVPDPGETAGQWWESSGHAEAIAAYGAAHPDRPTPTTDLERVAEWFLNDFPADLRAEALSGGRAPNDAVFSTPFPLAAWPSIPTRAIVGRDDAFFPAEFQHRLIRDRLGIEADELPGGHLLAVSQPVVLADTLVGHLDR